MFGLFRKRTKVSVEETAVALLGFLEGVEAPKSDESRLTLDGVEMDPELLRGELTYLRMFAIEYAVQAALAHHKLCESLINAYRSQLRSAIERAVPGTTMLQEMQRRIDTYWKVVDIPHQMGPSWNVAEAFAGYCGQESDPMLIMEANIRFIGAVKFVSEFVKSLKIV